MKINYIRINQLIKLQQDKKTLTKSELEELKNRTKILDKTNNQ